MLDLDWSHSTSSIISAHEWYNRLLSVFLVSDRPQSGFSEKGAPKGKMRERKTLQFREGHFVPWFFSAVTLTCPLLNPMQKASSASSIGLFSGPFRNIWPSMKRSPPKKADILRLRDGCYPAARDDMNCWVIPAPPSIVLKRKATPKTPTVHTS